MAVEEPKKIRLLHLADLFVNANEDFGPWLDNLTQCSEATIGAGQKYDYLVACGSLTCKATKENFEAAGNLLERVCKKVVNVDPEDPKQWRSRCIVAPGPRDGIVPQSGPNRARSFAPFNTHFFEKFRDLEYRGETPQEHWHPEGANRPLQFSVRVHEHFTSVGFFWDRSLIAENTEENAKQKLWDELERWHAQWTGHPALILVSSCVPSSMVVRDFLCGRELVHFVGRTPRAMIEELRYNALRWGPEHDDKDVRNDRANIHELKLHRTSAIEHRAQTFEIIDRDHVKQFPKKPKGPTAPAPIAFEPFRELLVQLWNTVVAGSPSHRGSVLKSPLHLIRGVPGAGKMQFFNRFARSRGANFSETVEADQDPDYLIEAVEIRNDGLPGLRKLFHSANVLRNRRGRFPNANRIKPILFVFDQTRSLGRTHPHILEQIRTEGRVEAGTQRRSLADMHIVLLSNEEAELDSILNETDRFEPDEDPDDGRFFGYLLEDGGGREREVFGFLLPFLSPETSSCINAMYRDVPFEDDHVVALTGSLVGTRVRLLESLRENRSELNTVPTRSGRWAELVRIMRAHDGSQRELRNFLRKYCEQALDAEIPEDVWTSNSLREIDRDEILLRWLERWSGEAVRPADILLPLLAVSEPPPAPE